MKDSHFKCLYCLKTEVPFTSVEHVIPYAMGNTEIILPKGVVCDICNNKVLSQLDTILMDFTPIKYQRTFKGIPSRTGSFPTFKAPSFHMTHTSENHIDVKLLGKGEGITENLDGNTIMIEMDVKGNKKMTDKYARELSRSLYKIGLAMAYIDLGKEVALSSRFDEVRSIILNDIKNFHGRLYFPLKAENLNEAGVQHWDLVDEQGTLSFFRFYYLGVEIYFEMERRTMLPGEPLSEDKVHEVEF